MFEIERKNEGNGCSVAVALRQERVSAAISERLDSVFECSMLIGTVRLPSHETDVRFPKLRFDSRIFCRVCSALIYFSIHGSQSVTAFFLNRRRGTNFRDGIDRWFSNHNVNLGRGERNAVFGDFVL